MRLCDLSLLMLSFLAVAISQRGNNPNSGANAPVLEYKAVDWPTEATSVAGFPAGAWNFIQVVSVATSARGNILLLHRGAQPIMEFEPGGKLVRAWGDGMFSEGKVVFVPQVNWTPTTSHYSAVYGPAGCTSCGAHSVRVDQQGNIWLVDATNHMIYKMDPQGKDVLMRLGQKGVAGTGHNNFNLPTDVAFAPNGDFYVSDGYAGARVVKFSRSGKYMLEFGKRGTGPGEFGLPHAVAVDAQGRVYVSDRDNQRIEVFDADGKFLNEWAGTGGISALVITKDQKIWTGGVLRDLDGKVLGRLPTPAALAAAGGRASGKAAAPAGGAVFVGGHGGIALTASGDIYIAQLSGRVDKFAKQ